VHQLTWVEGVELDAIFPKGREKLHFNRPVDCVINALIDRGLNVAICFADPNDFSNFPAEKASDVVKLV